MPCTNSSQQPFKEQGREHCATRSTTDASQKLAQEYLNIAGVVLVALDRDGTITMLSRKGHEVLEYTDGELVGKNWFETCLPERKRAEVTSVFHQLMAGNLQAFEHFENEVLTRTGHERVIAWRNTLLRDETGKCIGTLGSGEDITDRKRAEESLRESEERFRCVIETFPDAMIVMDLNGRLIMANPQTARLFGAESVDELMSHVKFCYDAIAPEDRQRAAEAIQRLLASDFSATPDFCLLRRDGSRWPAEVRSSVQRDSEGNPTALITVIRDITERKQMEEAVRQKSAELEQFFNCSLDLLCIADTDGYFHRLNREWESALGYRMDELQGRRFLDLVHPDDLPSTLEAIAHLKRQEPLLNFTNRYRCKNGSYRWIEWRAFPAGKAIYAAARDVTERNRTERELLKALQAAEAANRSKTEFLANVSHEIRTPMTAILGFADLLMSANLSHEEQREFLETIQRNGQSLLALINDILDLSKIDSKKMSVESVECSLCQIVDDVLAIVGARAKDKGVSLEVDYRPSLPETIHTDPMRLGQILVNLVGNAIKFTKHGTVRISIAAETSPQNATCIRFAVSDTGIGIAPEKLGELFQPFTQADASTTRRFGGTGLGLAISKRLANLLGGDIEVASEPGRGSTFTVTIDVAHAAETRTTCNTEAGKQTPEAESMERAVEGRVLLVEDVADIQGLLCRILRGMHLEVETAKDGRSACEKATRSSTEGKPFDLILMDLQMPKMDGLQTTRWLRNHGWKGPIVALTAHTMAGDREKCLAVGCDDYVAKATSLDELRAVVARHLRRESSVGSTATAPGRTTPLDQTGDRIVDCTHAGSVSTP